MNRKKNNKFSKITIRLASPESVLKESHGEVLKPETINYRTHKPERDGLFCERIFGPVKDYECACGKYKRIRYKGIVCDRCGVEVTEKKVRRERMGHISLIVPVVHIWCFRTSPNKIGYLLGLSSKKLEMIIYYERYVVIQGGGAFRSDGASFQKGDFLTEEEYLSVLNQLPKGNQYLENTDPKKFIAKMGAECIEDLLNRIDLDSLSIELRNQVHNETSKQRRTEALKRLQVVESFREGKKNGGNVSYMIIHVLSVIPPELRPLVPLDGGRYAASDMTDLYRRVLIRNNRLKRLIEIKAPEVILRNEKRMLQEAVDSLFDNSRKVSAVKSEANRPLKSLSDSLKGKQGRFRQNLLGKRVDYSARSVIVVGPHLKLHECGLPKDMAAELYKPFIIRKLIERGVVKTVKSSKKIIDKRDPMIWDILENVLKGHPILLNRAPTLHRLGIQAFQPKLIEGKAIQLHPLVCAAFNADFDGDQMAVHLPLSSGAILEAQLLMLASQNILNPANGSPITVPSQDMVLGLYYMTKPLLSSSNSRKKVKGEGLTFYSPEEVEIAYNQNKVELHALIRVKVDLREEDKFLKKLIETTVGRVLFNQVVPKKVGYINESLTKKSLREIIGKILYLTDVPTTSKFLDDIKELGFYNAFKGGLSFGLGDIIIPNDKKDMVFHAIKQVDSVKMNYNMGLITNNERYNQVIDIWTNTNSMLTDKVMKHMREDRQGFNPVYMMLDSGARGSKEQIRQLSGMRGLMAKPQKAGSSGGEIIENPILSNFREGLSILEYFISTHGARKGLADTALKTADAGYLTRRLVDAAQDVIITIEDCNTLRGLKISSLKKNEEIVDTLFDRILGRISLNDIFHPKNKKLIISSGDMIDEKIAGLIEKSGIEFVEVRSPLTCEAKMGICSKCYGRNLSTGKIVKKGEAVGVIAAQSIGEPGTQLTLRTFHVGGTAGNIAESSQIRAKYDGIIEFEDLKTVQMKNDLVEEIGIVVSRSTEMKLFNQNRSSILMTNNVPYGATLYVKHGDSLKEGDKICKWDLYNAVIVAEFSGIIYYQHLEQGVTFQVEIDDQTGFQEKVITEVRNKNLIPTLKIINENNEELKVYNLPVGAHLMVEDKEKIEVGKILVKVPRKSAKSGDITGGLPRLSELFEARNPSNPAVVSEMDGIVSHGKIKRGNREIIVESKTGDIRKYLVKLSNQILVQENDYVKAGMPLSDGAVTPNDILNIRGARAVQEYLVKEIQEVYRLQGVKINDKHFEVIVLQMMRKVEVINVGDTRFLEGNIEYKDDFVEENDRISQMRVIEDSGDTEIFKSGDIISIRDFRNENAVLKYKKKKLIKTRNAIPATARPILQGITRAALQTKSFISAASFQETTKVLSEAAISSKTDYLYGLKENVIVGHKIPAGTGLKEYENISSEIVN